MIDDFPPGTISRGPIAGRRWGFLLLATGCLAVALAAGLGGCAAGPSSRVCLQVSGLRASAAEDTVGPVGTDPALMLEQARQHRWLGDYLRTVEYLDATESLLGGMTAGSGSARRREVFRQLALERAWLHYDRGEWQDGLRVVRAALDLEPGDAQLRLIHGLLAAQDGRRSMALAAADDFTRAEPHNPHGPWIRAAYRVSTGQLREAFGLVLGLTPNRENQVECWRDKGEIAERLEEYSRAGRWYEKSAHSLPFGQAKCVQRLTYPRLRPGSRKTHQKVWLAFDRYYVTGSLSAYTRLAMDRFDAAADGAGKAFWAEQVVNAAGILLRKGIDEPWAHRARGLVFAYGDQTDRAIRDLREASRRLERLKRADGRIEATLGHLFLEKKDHIGSLPHLREAVRLQPDAAGPWRDLGLALIMDEQAAAAEQALTRSIDLDPNSATAWYNRGLLYLHARDLDRARTDLQEAARLAPDNAEVINLIQQLRALQGRSDSP